MHVAEMTVSFSVGETTISPPLRHRTRKEKTGRTSTLLRLGDLFTFFFFFFVGSTATWQVAWESMISKERDAGPRRPR